MKLFRKLHLWLSVPFGLVITILCFTGAILVFEREVTELSQPHLYKVKALGEEAMPLEELINLASEHIAPDAAITGVTITNDPERTYQLHLSNTQRTPIYVDQYSGEVLGQSKRLPLFSTTLKLHRWLMGSPRAEDGGIGIGKLIVGISTIMFVFVLISGAVIWWPRNRQMLKNRLSIKWSKGCKRLLYDLHIAGGIYALVVLLALSLTGLTWSFSWYRGGFYKVFGSEIVTKSKSKGKEITAGAQSKAVEFAKWQSVYEELAARDSSYAKITISNGTAQLYHDKWGNQRASDSYTFDVATGEIVNFVPYSEVDKSKKIGGWIYSIHIGSWGGLFSRIITFLAALLGASLPLTGYYLWFKRLHNRHSVKREG